MWRGDFDPQELARQQAHINPKIAEALTELQDRLAQRGLTTRLLLRDVTYVIAHRDGDTSDGSLPDGPWIVHGLAVEIARERGLPHNWLHRLGSYLLPRPPVEDPMTIRQHIVAAILRVVSRAAERCVAVARQPDTGRLRKHCALAVLGMGKAVLAVLQRSRRSSRTRTPQRTSDCECGCECDT